MAAAGRPLSVSDQFSLLTPGVTGARPSRGSERRSSRPSTEALTTAATIFALTVVLLLPALYNGYPILFPDTADYLLRSETLLPSPIRAPGYALWIRITSAGQTLWLPVIAQSLLAAAIVWRSARVFGRPRASAALGGAIILVFTTSIGWASSKAMPDLFIAPLILGLYLIACHWTQLHLAGRLLAIASVVVGATMHLTNVYVGLVALATMLVLHWWDRADRRTLRSCAGAVLLLAATAVATRTYENIRRDAAQKPFNGSMFILSHLVETGLAHQLLEERCSTEQFALCPVRDTLTRQVELFVWRPESSPRYGALHDDPALIRAETIHLLGGIARHHPLALLGSIFSYTGEQLVTFRVNDDIWRHRNRTEVQRVIARMYPADLPAQERARQQANTLRSSWTPMVHLVAFLAAAAFSIIMLRRAYVARRIHAGNAAGLHVVVWVALIANAAICANLASVFSRYQSRVSWLLPFAVLMSLLERDDLRVPLPRTRTGPA